MNSIIFQIVKLFYPDDDFRFKYSIQNQLIYFEIYKSNPLASTEIISKSDENIDFTISWPEPRVFKDIYTGNEIEEITLNIFRQATCRFKYLNNVLICNGLNRQYSKLFQMIWSNNLQRPAYLETKFDVIKLLTSTTLEQYFEHNIYDVTIDDLPIETIPSARVSVKKSQLHDIRNLIKETNSVIKNITLVPKNDDIDFVSISSRGIIKISSRFYNLEQYISYADNLIDKLNLLGE